ncbi:recombination and repair protein RecT [Mycobacterium marinum]|uniref:recombination protein RecT n=1 Tax=Mycobacterium marinum TaxID=1781 RepID=UPI000EDEBBD5|nr:recombination protein RecT [Mycobacterium marinum]RFZ11219.1 recombination and repair protein RecT [Mycobacterium marinum]
MTTMKDDYRPVAQNRTVAKAGNDLRSEIQQMEKHFQRAMPQGFEAVQLIRDVFTCLRINPKLAECEHQSVLGSVMTCAQLGLRPGVGVLGQAYLVPFWDSRAGCRKAQLIIGYQGYVELAYRTDKIASLHARTVYTNDHIEIEYGAHEDRFIHRPYLDGPRGEYRLFYAVGRTTNGGYSMTDPMTLADMETHRDRYATARNKQHEVVGPWLDQFEGMAHKTTIRQLMKLLPKSTEIQRAMTHDGGVRVDVSPGVIDDEPDYIDGEVADEPTSGSAAPPSDQAEVKMATRQQITKLKNIRQAEKYDDDSDWFDYIRTMTSADIKAEKDLSEYQAQVIIDAFNQESTQAQDAQQ